MERDCVSQLFVKTRFIFHILVHSYINFVLTLIGTTNTGFVTYFTY